MPLYLGSSEKLKITAPNGGAIRLHVYTPIPITNGDLLRSSDDYILTDSRGVYLTAKEAN